MTPVLSDVPLLNSRAYVVASSPHHHHPSRALGGKRMSAPGQARIVLQRVYPAADPFRAKGLREGPLATDASQPPPLTGILAVSRDLPVIARNPDREREREREGKEWKQ